MVHFKPCVLETRNYLFLVLINYLQVDLQLYFNECETCSKNLLDNNRCNGRHVTSVFQQIDPRQFFEMLQNDIEDKGVDTFFLVESMLTFDFVSRWLRFWMTRTSVYHRIEEIYQERGVTLVLERNPSC